MTLGFDDKTWSSLFLMNCFSFYSFQKLIFKPTWTNVLKVLWKNGKLNINNLLISWIVLSMKYFFLSFIDISLTVTTGHHLVREPHLGSSPSHGALSLSHHSTAVLLCLLQTVSHMHIHPHMTDYWLPRFIFCK